MKRLIHQEIDATAARDPSRKAILFLDENLSYEQLSQRSNALAHTLIDHGVRRHDPVGIYMDKSIETAVALYGIMKAGAAYVPLDPAAPQERFESVVRDCAIRCIVTAPNKCRLLRSLLPEKSTIECLIGLDGQEDLPFRQITWDEVGSAPSEKAPAVKIAANDLAYIIYTSGSTGNPKGIMHTHASGLSFARWAAHEYGFGPSDILSNHAPLHFDLSILDYFAGAVAGCTTSIIPEAYTKLPASYSQLIADHRITVLYTVPFAMIQLLNRGLLAERDLSALRWAIFGGEPFPLKYLRALMLALPHIKFDNIYGPAEINGVTHFTVGPLADDATAIPIGPLATSAQGLIVDENDQPVERGDVGELLVRTPTMMRGYWGQAELNARSFYRRRVAPKVEEVFFRTGDLVRADVDETLWFLGRKDRQIKVRGYRIELDEIEAALSVSFGVDEAAAFAVPHIEGSQEVRAAVTFKPGYSVTEQTLMADLKTRLPWYAVPSGIAVREQFPRTSTGKISRRELRDEYLDIRPPPIKPDVLQESTG